MGERGFFVLAYDIADDRRRARIAKKMESVAERVQGSVFEAYLTDQELKELVKKVNRILKENEDSLRIYSLCGPCRGKIAIHGKARVTQPPGVRII